MGLDQVVQEILDEGKLEARQIEEAAKREADAIAAEARDEAETLRSKRANEAEAQAEARQRRITAAAQLEGKKKRLDAQSDVLATIRTRVEERITKLPADERAQLLQTLVKGSGADQFGNGAQAWGRKEDKDAIEKLGFSFAGEIDCLGGAVIESPDGTMREDLRFETVLDEVWRDRVHQIAKAVLER